PLAKVVVVGRRAKELVFQPYGLSLGFLQLVPRVGRLLVGSLVPVPIARLVAKIDSAGRAFACGFLLDMLLVVIAHRPPTLITGMFYENIRIARVPSGCGIECPEPASMVDPEVFPSPILGYLDIVCWPEAFVDRPSGPRAF